MSHWPGHRNYGNDIYKLGKGLVGGITQTSLNAGPQVSSFVKNFVRDTQTTAGTIGKAVTGSDNLANVKVNPKILADATAAFTKSMTDFTSNLTKNAPRPPVVKPPSVPSFRPPSFRPPSGSGAFGFGGPDISKINVSNWRPPRPPKINIPIVNVPRVNVPVFRPPKPPAPPKLYRPDLSKINVGDTIKTGLDTAASNIGSVGTKINETLTAGIDTGTKMATDVGSAVGTVASDILTEPMEKVGETLTAIKEDALYPVGEQVVTGMQNLTTNIGHVSKELGVFLKDPTKLIRDQTSAWEKKIKGYGDDIWDNVLGTTLGGLGEGIRGYLKKPGGKKAPGASAPGLGGTESIGSVGSYAKSFGTEGLKVATLSGKKSRLKQNKRALRV